MSQFDSQYYQEKYRQLIEGGYCILENILDSEFIAELREVSGKLVAAMTAEEAREQRSTGSLIPVTKDPLLTELITLPQALHAMEAMGFRDIKFSSGYVISKPPKSPRLFWHFDWGAWAHPRSYEKVPPQMFLMYYLVATSRENGCLRVIPGSHLNDHPLHDLLTQAHSAELSEARDLQRPEFQDRPDEVDVTVRVGDLVIGDARILHASHANTSDERRTVITLWYHPNFYDLPEPLQGYVANLVANPPDDWPQESKDLLTSIQAYYDGGAEPVRFSRERMKVEDFRKSQ